MPALLLKYISRLATNHLRRPKKAISVGKLTDLSSAGVQLGVFAAAKVPQGLESWCCHCCRCSCRNRPRLQLGPLRSLPHPR